MTSGPPPETLARSAAASGRSRSPWFLGAILLLTAGYAASLPPSQRHSNPPQRRGTPLALVRAGKLKRPRRSLYVRPADVAVATVRAVAWSRPAARPAPPDGRAPTYSHPGDSLPSRSPAPASVAHHPPPPLRC